MGTRDTSMKAAFADKGGKALKKRYSALPRASKANVRKKMAAAAKKGYKVGKKK
jgi:hypothetical protein